MRNRSIAVPAAKPRNPVIRAVLDRVVAFGSKRHRDKRQAGARAARKDLDQRVRDCGEWSVS